MKRYLEREYGEKWCCLIHSYFEKEWNIKLLSRNSNLTMKTILRYPYLSWEFEYISRYASITMEDILSNLNIPWDWSGISANPNITMRDILNNPDKPWRWDYISANPNITMDDILNNSDKSWCWQLISENTNLTIDMILKNNDKNWDWCKISCNPNITIEDILNNDDDKFISNPKKFLNFIFGIKVKKWIWSKVSLNPNLTIKHVLDNPEKSWDWYDLSVNIPIKDILEHHEKPWKLNLLGQNKTLTLQYIIYCFENDITISILDFITNYYIDISILTNKMLEESQILLFYPFSSNKTLKINDILNEKIKFSNYINISGNDFELEKKDYVKKQYKIILLTHLLKQLKNKNIKNNTKKIITDKNNY